MKSSRLSLRARLLLWIALTVGAGLLLSLAVISQGASSMRQRDALDYVEQLARSRANLAQKAMDEAAVAARTMAQSLRGMRQAGRTDRAAADALLRGALEGTPGFVGVWTGWEPNAFDGQDEAFAGKPGHDASGRYVPYWNRGNGVAVEPLVDYDKPGNGDYYQLAKQSRQSVLIEPYAYNIGGKQQLITTLSSPILIDGAVVGVAGVDITLASLQTVVEQVKVFDSGYASLFSHTGIYVGDRDPAQVGKTLPPEAGFAQVLAAVREGQRHVVREADAVLGRDVTRVYVPLHVQGIAASWVFAITVPDDEVLADVQRLRWMAVGLGVLGVLLVVVVLWQALERLVLRPIGGEPADAAAVADRVARGDLSQPIALRPGDTSSLMAQLAHMQHSLEQVVAHVRQGADTVAMASQEISHGNLDLSNRTEQQASALEETSAAMQHLGTTVRGNAEQAHQANRQAQSAAGVAVQGGEVVGQVVHTMREIQDSSRQIADIIGVIDGIAFQTNILALNAAVEAARAGEQGRGFAVVAGEVRNLAQRSAEAAKQIKNLIDSSVERVTAGTALVDRAGATMQDVVAAIQGVTHIVEGISGASEHQSAGVQQVTEAVRHMDQATQQNASLVEEMAAAATGLKDQADQLVRAVAVFKLRG